MRIIEHLRVDAVLAAEGATGEPESQGSIRSKPNKGNPKFVQTGRMLRDTNKSKVP